MKNYRHGDIALIGKKTLPKGLLPSKTKILMKGVTGNDHAFDNGVFYEHKKGDNIIGYLVAENTTLLHPDHGEREGNIRKARIEDGIYEVRRQNEYTPEGLRPIID